MAAYTLSILSISSSNSLSLNNPSERSLILKPSCFLGEKFAIRSSNWSLLLASKRPSSTVATVSFSLLTSKGDKSSSENGPKWSARAIKSFAMAELEARKLKYPNTGTEALLMGILVEGTSLAAKFLREKGITLFKVREETVKLLGKSDMYFFSPEHPPLTVPAQRALDWAAEEKRKSGESGEISTTHMLLGIWLEKESAGHRILAKFGFGDENAKELAKNVSSALKFLFD